MAEQPIPIVVAAPPMRTGGTEQHLLHILPALAERGFAISVVLLAGGGALEAQLRAAKLSVISPAGDIGRPMRTIAQMFALRREVQRTQARVLHAFLSEPYFAAYGAHRLLPGRGPALVQGRRSLAFYGDRHPVARALERMMHRRASMLVGNSAAVATELMNECRAPDKVAVIHNGIPLLGVVTPDERAAARKAFGIGDDELVFAMVANFYPYKGHRELIEGIALASPALQHRWRLLLPGRNPENGELECVLAAAREMEIADRLILPGEVQGSRQTYAAADIGLLVSHTEGFSNSLIEGMAAGLPMIATAVGGNLDAVADKETGLLVPVGSPGKIAEAIRILAGDAGLRAAIGGDARRVAEMRFSLDTCVGAYEQLWRGLAQNGSGTYSTIL
jgi:glycosyltransferase involved in cell wall biosynthesis